MKKTLVLMMILLVSFVGTASALPILNAGFDNGLTDWIITTKGSLGTLSDGTPSGVTIDSSTSNNMAKFQLSNTGIPDPTTGKLEPALLSLSQRFYLDPLIDTIRVQFDFMFSNAVQTAGDFFRDVVRVDTVGNSTTRFDTVVANSRFDPISMMGTYGMNISLASLNLVDADPNARIIFTLRSMDAADSIAFLDNVSVAVVPVPEPATIFLLSSGLLGLGFLRSRKNI